MTPVEIHLSILESGKRLLDAMAAEMEVNKQAARPGLLNDVRSARAIIDTRAKEYLACIDETARNSSIAGPEEEIRYYSASVAPRCTIADRTPLRVSTTLCSPQQKRWN
jgi:hypothetical protein